MSVDCGLKQSMLDRFIRVSASQLYVRKLILFGSRASGKYTFNSDIDLAFQRSGPVDSQYYLEMEEAAGLYKLDLLDMDLIKEELLLEEIRSGVVLYDREKDL